MQKQNSQKQKWRDYKTHIEERSFPYWLRYQPEKVGRLKQASEQTSQNNRVMIAILGPPGKGKSSVLDYLQKELRGIPIGAVGATSNVPLFISHSSTTYFEVVFKNGNRTRITQQSEGTLARFNNDPNVKCIEAYTPFPLDFLPEDIREQVCFIDVPGAFSVENEEHTLLVFEVMEGANLILMFLDYLRPTTEDVSLFSNYLTQRRHDKNPISRTLFVFNKIDAVLTGTGTGQNEEKEAFVRGEVKKEHTRPLMQEIANLAGVSPDFITNRACYISVHLAQRHDLLKSYDIANSQDLLSRLADTSLSPSEVQELFSALPNLLLFEQAGYPNSVARMGELSYMTAFKARLIDLIHQNDPNRLITEDLLNRSEDLHNNIGADLMRQRGELADQEIEQKQAEINRLTNTTVEPQTRLVKAQIETVCLNSLNSISDAVDEHEQKCYTLVTQQKGNYDGVGRTYHGRENPYIRGEWSLIVEKTNWAKNHFISETKGWHNNKVQPAFNALQGDLSKATEGAIKDTAAKLNACEEAIRNLPQSHILLNNPPKVVLPIHAYVPQNVSFLPADDQSLVREDFWEWHFFNDDYRVYKNTPEVKGFMETAMRNHLSDVKSGYVAQYKATVEQARRELKYMVESYEMNFLKQRDERIAKLAAEIGLLERGKTNVAIDLSDFSPSLAQNTEELAEHAQISETLKTICNHFNTTF